jgi:hypothetical protein
MTVGSESPRGSKGVALTNWLVSKTSGLLERKTSRRGFLIGTAMAGSAVAVPGCQVVTQPGSPYVHLTDCGNSFCNDGWTEFCCGINGYNTCPSGSFPGGWWRADFSSFCNGTRYYIDCMQHCCGPLRSDGFCAGCEECRCAGDCGTRRVYCNYFRYGQCHTEIGTTGPIACRVVTCVPPYQSDPACINSPAVDNRTAEHAPNCLFNFEPGPPTPPAPPPRVAAVLASSCALVVPGSGGEILAVGRGFDGSVGTRTLLNGAWTPWFGIGGQITSGLAAVAAGSSDYVVGRGIDNAIWVNRRVALQWSGWRSLQGVSRSDPAVVADGDAVQIFVRGADDAVYVNRYDGSNVYGWTRLGGTITSDPVAVRDGSTIRVVARGLGDQMWENHNAGGAWSSGWNYIEGIASSDASCISNSSGTYAFIRGTDFAVWVNHFDGAAWSGWNWLGGAVTSEPAAAADPSGVRVFARGLDNGIYTNRLAGSTWSGWTSLGGQATADPVALAGDAGSSVFIRGTDGGLWYNQLTDAGSSGWQSLSGYLSPVRAGL